MCLMPNLALSLPSVGRPRREDTHTAPGAQGGQHGLTAGTWGQALQMSLQLGAGAGGGEPLLIYLWPWHSPWGGAPPRAGTDGVPGSQQRLRSRCHPPGETVFVILPGSHGGRGLWSSWDPPGQRELGPERRSQAQASCISSAQPPWPEPLALLLASSHSGLLPPPSNFTLALGPL